MGKILRRNGKLVAQLHFYDSPTARLGVVVPKGRTTQLPKTAKWAAVKFVDEKTWRSTKGRPIPKSKGGNGTVTTPIILKADTVRKYLDLY